MADKKAQVASATAAKGADAVSQLIDAKITELGDWRGEMLARIRRLIREADRDVVEEVKWRKPSNPAGVPVWSHAGILCTGETKACGHLHRLCEGAVVDMCGWRQGWTAWL